MNLEKLQYLLFAPFIALALLGWNIPTVAKWSMVILCLTGIGFVFLGKELLKKFLFFQEFVDDSDQLVEYYHPGAEARDYDPQMRNIILRSGSGEPFTALVGFTLEIPIIDYDGFDYYGFVRSNQNGVAVISTYIGNGEVDFAFYLNTDEEVGVEEGEVDLDPDAEFPPHFYQKWLGFYA